MKLAFALSVFSTLLGTDVHSLQRVQNPSNSRFVVVGRVIDARAYPIPKASLVLIPARVTVDGTYHFHATDPEGRFRIEESTSAKDDSWVLYALTNVSAGPAYFLVPPFSGQSDELYKRFPGLPINPRDELIDVGDIEVSIRYGELILRLVTKTKQPLLAPELNARDIPCFLVRIRDDKGDTVAEDSFPAGAILLDRSALWAALPEGKWQLELSTNGEHWYRMQEPRVTPDCLGKKEVTFILPRLGGSETAAP